MKKKLLSIALIGCIAFAASSWTLILAPQPKTIVNVVQWDDSYPFDGSYYNDCTAEFVDYTGTLNDMGTFTVYDDGSLRANFHYNYSGVQGIGQTSGDIYHLTGAGHLNNNYNSADMFIVVQNGTVTIQGSGVVSNFKSNVLFITNANGELVRSNVDFNVPRVRC